jgi:hypothetical protein
MRRINNVIALSMGVLLWAGAGAGAQDTPASAGKAKKWSGKLVDAPCMTKALNILAASPQQNTGPDVSRFLGGPSPGQNPGRRPGEYPTDLSDHETPQMQRKVQMIANAAKLCAATEYTTSFGLALQNGDVMKFDGDGNSKASQAVKDLEPEPGKAVKATVKGIDQGIGPVQVTSIEIKHKGKGKHGT